MSRAALRIRGDGATASTRRVSARRVRLLLLLVAGIAAAVLALPRQSDAVVYFGNFVNGEYNFGEQEYGVWIARASMDGSNLDPYFVRTGSGTLNLDVQSSNLFWAFQCRPKPRGSAEEDCTPPGIIGRVGVDGSGLTPALVDEAWDAGAIGSDGTHVYWVERRGDYIARARLDGTEVDHTWYDARDALDPSFLGTRARDLEVDGGYIYVSSHRGITRIALDRSSYQTLFVPLGIDGACCASGLAVDDSYIYFGWDVHDEPASIGRVAKDGTGPVDYSWIPDLEGPLDVEVNSTHVFWTDPFRPTGPGSVGRARLDGSAVERDFIQSPPDVTGFRPAGLALDEIPNAPVPPERPNPTGTGFGDGGPSPDPTAGASSVCIELRGGTRKRTKAVPGGGEVLQTVSQSSDPSLPIKIKAGARRGVAIESAGFRVNKKAVTSSGTTAYVPVGRLKLGKRNRISSDLTLTNGRRITVNEIIVVLKCPLPPVTCKRVSAGTRLKCSSSMPRRARSVKVTVAGPNGARASGSAKVKLRKDRKKGEYSMTMTPNSTLPPGKYLYKHVATTTRKGEKLLTVRVLTLE